jgi:hypothetical protein
MPDQHALECQTKADECRQHAMLAVFATHKAAWDQLVAEWLRLALMQTDPSETGGHHAAYPTRYRSAQEGHCTTSNGDPEGSPYAAAQD